MINESGVYEQAPEIIYDEIANKPENKSSDIDLNDPTVKQAALDAFSPEFLRTSAESFLSGGYSWLQGESKDLNFEIDLEPAKKDFVKSVISNQAKEVKNLPECTVSELQKLESKNTDIFSLKCLPPGINISEEAKKAEKQILEDKDFISQTKFDSNDIKDKNGEPITKNLPELQNQFAAIKALPIVFALVALIFGTGIYFMNRPYKKALSILGKIFVVSGIFILLAPFAINLFTQAILDSNTTKSVAAELVAPIIKQFNQSTAYIYYIYGAVIIGLGLLQIFIPKYLVPAEKQSKKKKATK